MHRNAHAVQEGVIYLHQVVDEERSTLEQERCQSTMVISIAIPKAKAMDMAMEMTMEMHLACNLKRKSNSLL
jgi:hypothetical protein